MNPHEQRKNGRNKLVILSEVKDSFTKAYKTNRLVYYEMFGDPRDAIAREKEIKGWKCSKKNALVETLNPKWTDLSPIIFQQRGVMGWRSKMRVILSKAKGPRSWRQRAQSSMRSEHIDVCLHWIHLRGPSVRAGLALSAQLPPRRAGGMTAL